jgi:hypothetical protein
LLALLTSLALALATVAHADPLESAQRAFYNGQYEAAVEMTQVKCFDAPDLDACELRSAALLFQIRRTLAAQGGKEPSVKRCTACSALLTQFDATLQRGKTLARERLQLNRDDETLFLLSRLDLNYVWLQLGVLGRKTGWGEYWEARRALDDILERNPTHVRARVARGWIDYIVDTKMPRGTRWLLGGGNKKRGLLTIREAADAEAAFFARVEARFALWDMQVRERKVTEAVETAKSLAVDFPDNRELITFIATHGR